jgi:hypothetical protein
MHMGTSIARRYDIGAVLEWVKAHTRVGDGGEQTRWRADEAESKHTEK